MSFFRSSFSFRRTTHRRAISQSPLQLSAEERVREFAAPYQTIDAYIGNQNMIYDPTHGDWMSGNLSS